MQVFFACKICTDTSKSFRINPDSEIQNTGTTVSKNMEDGQDNLLSSIKNMFEDKITAFEAKIEKIVETKLNEKLKSESLNKDASTLPPPEYKSYASKVLKVPEEVKKIIQDAKNDDKIEEKEEEKRSKNFILHGADEYGNTVEEVKKQDKQYINEILEHLGVKKEPAIILRLGDSKKSTRRPIKITMKTKEDKEKVMERY